MDDKTIKTKTSRKAPIRKSKLKRTNDGKYICQECLNEYWSRASLYKHHCTHKYSRGKIFSSYSSIVEFRSTLENLLINMRSLFTQLESLLNVLPETNAKSDEEKKDTLARQTI